MVFIQPCAFFQKIWYTPAKRGRRNKCARKVIIGYGEILSHLMSSEGESFALSSTFRQGGDYDSHF
jgi:hypothetical protein